MLRLSSNYESRSRHRHDAALVGDPARANMLMALMTGRALTASELAHEAGITPQTASSHLVEAGGRRPDRAGKTGPPSLLPPHRSRCRRRARGACGACRARRPHAGAHRAKGSGIAPRPDLLRPSRRRSRRADARQHEDSSGWCGRSKQDDRTHRRGRAFPGDSLQISPKRWPIRAARCARPASTGASGGITSRARWGLR